MFKAPHPFAEEPELKPDVEAEAATPSQNSTDEEKLLISSGGPAENVQAEFSLSKR